MTPFLSVIIPTLGRPTLRRTLDSVMQQPESGDVEVLVVEDTFHGVQPKVRSLVLGYGPRVRHVAHNAGHACSGMPQRNMAMPLARGAYLAFLDDDDVWTPGALASIRRGLHADPDHTLIYRMQYADGSTLWRSQRVACGNVGTPMLVVPNEPGRLGTWGARYAGDYDFIASTLALRAETPIWHDDVVALIRPEAAA